MTCQSGDDLHDEVLAPPDELTLGVDDGLQEPQVLGRTDTGPVSCVQYPTQG